MMRAALLWMLLLFIASPAHSEITDPTLLQIADAYQRSVSAIEPESSAAELLARLNEARKAGDSADTVRLSEQLVALNDANAQSWLNLSKAWLSADGAASNGLAAGVRAAQLALSEGDRLEALLLVSAFLRNRLDQDRARYGEAQAAVREADAALIQIDELEEAERFSEPDAADPFGRVASLQQAREDAVAAGEAAAREIAATAAALDEVYREIQANIPTLELSEMQQGDRRLDFRVLMNEGDSDYPVTEYRTVGNDIRSCIVFSKRLKENHRVYGSMVTIEADGEILPLDSYDIRAEGDRLCILRLEPGTYYYATLSAELPSEDDTVLGVEQGVGLSVPDLANRISFGDGEFILPGSGPGELPIFLTNVEEFPLAIHRIADRSLNRHLALGHIRNGIPNREHKELISQFSEVLWQGFATRAMEEDEINETVRSHVPVRAILEDRADWIGTLDDGQWNNAGQVRSMTQPVRAISDEQLSIDGEFVAGRLDFDTETAQLFVPGVYALVAPVPDSGPARAVYCEGEGDDCQVYAAQWFLMTDIGLTFYEGERDFTVLARSLASGGPVAGARIELVSSGNRVLAAAETDANGVARFSRSLTTGEGSNALIAILAQTGKDFSFLKYGSERLDLSRLNIGEGPQERADGALLYTERGIYQPGETINAFALLRERGADAALPAMNAELRLEISDYIVARRPLAAGEWSAGGMLVPLAVPDSARPGAALLKLVSASNDILAETRIQLGKIRPDRARLSFSEGGEDGLQVRLGPNGTAEITGRVSAQYLYGAENTGQAAAANLKAEVTVRVSPVASPIEGCFAGLAFGAFDDSSLPTVSRNFVDYTDADGVLELSLAGIRLPVSTKPLAATIEITLFDASGPVAGGQAEIPVPAEQVALGISAVPRLSLAETGGYRISFDIAAVRADGSADFQRDIDIKLERERESYAWESVDGVWQPIQTRQREEVSTTTLRLSDFAPAAAAGGTCPATVEIEDAATGVEDGRYVITATDRQTGAMASVRFGTGVAQTSIEDLEPNIFVLSASKERYAPDEKVVLNIEAPFAEGEVLVAVASHDILAWFPGEVRGGKGTVSFDPDPAWGAGGFHALATAFKVNSGARQLGPARAIGAAYFEISDEGGGFDLSISRQRSLDDFLRPEETLRFDVCVNAADGTCGAGAPAETYAVAFVVDEGLLSLTGHEAELERAEEDFLGERRFGLRLMDNYGRLLLKEGGDRPGRLALSNYTSNRIVAAAQGPVRLQDGRASFSFEELGLQSGTLKLHVVAWSGAHMASARDSVTVRHFIVSNLGVPEFFLAGDRPVLPLRLENISFHHQGDYGLDISASGGIGVSLGGSDGSRMEPDADGIFVLPIATGQPQDLFVTLDIPPGLEGEHELTIELSAIGASVDLPPEERRRSWTLAVRPSAVMVQEYLSFPLGQQPTNLARLLEGVIEGRYDPETVEVVASFASGSDMLRVAAGEGEPSPTIALLDEMVWLGMVELQDASLAEDASLRDRVQETIDNVQALQVADGAFVPYRTDGDFIPAETGFYKAANGKSVRHGVLRNAAALDFLTRARAAGYAVSPDAITNSLAFLEGRVRDAIQLAVGSDYMDPTLLCSFDTRYAMLLLVKEDRLSSPEVGALQECADASGEETASGGGFAGAEVQEAVAEGTVFSDLVNLAVFSEFGYQIDPQDVLSAWYDSPQDYLGDLDQYRRAIALSMLANAGADRAVVEPIAASFFEGVRAPLDLRTKAWLARSAADLDLPDMRLTAADLQTNNPEMMALDARTDGIIVSAEIPYTELQRQSLSVEQVDGAAGRGFLKVSGRLLDGQDIALPESSLRRRYFRSDTGMEFDPAEEQMEVGDEIVVMIEATAEALAVYSAQSMRGLGTSYGAVTVEALLPSAFALVGEGLSGIEPKGDLAELPPLGNLRSVESDAQAWRAVIVPESRRAAAEYQKEEEAEPAMNEGFGFAPAATEPEMPADLSAVEFRQAFVVNVMAAGTFLFPGTTVDPLDIPGNTLLSEATPLQVAIPENPQR